MVNACTGGTLMSKTEDEAYNLLEELANDECQWSGERRLVRKQAGKHEVDAITLLTAQVASLTKQLQSSQLGVHVTQTPQQICELCQGNHPIAECQVGNPFV